MLKKFLLTSGTIGTIFVIALMFSLYNSNYFSDRRKEDLGCGYVKRDNMIYIDDHQLSSAFDTSKVDSFTYGSNYEWGHARTMHYQIPDIDATTFKINKDNCKYGVDKNNVYTNGAIINGLPPGEFEIIGYGFSRSKHDLFFWENKVTDFDIDSFALVAGSVGYRDKGRLVKDRNALYYVSSYASFTGLDGGRTNYFFKKIDSIIDLDSIRVVSLENNYSSYIADKNGLYYIVSPNHTPSYPTPYITAFQIHSDPVNKNMNYSLRKLANVAPNDNFDSISVNGPGAFQRATVGYDCNKDEDYSSFIIAHDTVYACGQKMEGVTPQDLCSEYAKDFATFSSKVCAKYVR